MAQTNDLLMEAMRAVLDVITGNEDTESVHEHMDRFVQLANKCLSNPKHRLNVIRTIRAIRKNQPDSTCSQCPLVRFFVDPPCPSTLLILCQCKYISTSLNSIKIPEERMNAPKKLERSIKPPKRRLPKAQRLQKNKVATCFQWLYTEEEEKRVMRAWGWQESD